MQLGQRVRSHDHHERFSAGHTNHHGARARAGENPQFTGSVGYPCDHVEVANPFVLANDALDEATADCGGENLDIAVFASAEQAEEYGRQSGGSYAAGDGWVIVTETLTFAERIADGLGGTAG
jgi:hypothetical protein